MDLVYVAGLALLWAVMALLVGGLRKLDRTQKGRP